MQAENTHSRDPSWAFYSVLCKAVGKVREGLFLGALSGSKSMNMEDRKFNLGSRDFCCKRR